MVMETMQQILTNLGMMVIDMQLEERLIDSILYAFQEQAVDASVTGSNAFQNGLGCQQSLGQVLFVVGLEDIFVQEVVKVNDHLLQLIHDFCLRLFLEPRLQQLVDVDGETQNGPGICVEKVLEAPLEPLDGLLLLAKGGGHDISIALPHLQHKPSKSHS